MKINKSFSVENKTKIEKSDIKETKNTKEIKKDGEKLMELGAKAVAFAGMAQVNKGKPITLDEFKKNGSFKDGKAELNGKPFSGKIAVSTKKGTKILEYSEGQLVSTKKKSIVFENKEKDYTYSPSGKIETVNGKNLLNYTIEDKDGKTNVIQDGVRVAKTDYKQDNEFPIGIYRTETFENDGKTPKTTYMDFLTEHKGFETLYKLESSKIEDEDGTNYTYPNGGYIFNGKKPTIPEFIQHKKDTYADLKIDPKATAIGKKNKLWLKEVIRGL